MAKRDVIFRCLMLGALITLVSACETPDPSLPPGTAMTAHDARLRGKILASWDQHDPTLAQTITVGASEGLITLGGTVNDPLQRVLAIRLAWEIEDVTGVVDEIQLAGGKPSKAAAKDNGITVRLRTKLTFDPAIASTNYSLETINGTVYLMGRAQSDDEIGEVVKTASAIPEVKKVISYIQLKSAS